MKDKLVIRNIVESNIDDIFRVCSHKNLDNPEFEHGIILKREWMKNMIKTIGPVAKIAYLNSKPVAQIMFYPETALPYILQPREKVIRVECAYNAFPESRGKGIGDSLMKSLVADCKLKECRFLVANTFSTGEGVSLEEYYKRNGFLEGEDELYLLINDEYKPKKKQKFKPLEEDKNKALLFYNKNCEFSYRFAEKTRKVLNEIDPNLKIEMIDMWKHPKTSVNRGNELVIVNAIPIKSCIGDEDEFKSEVKKALQS
ncbi:MAG: GNAT family N-acetyltransferase [Promethearchaeota archaeon]|jgi:GNAT superfamily N-acetyltransferase